MRLVLISLLCVPLFAQSVHPVWRDITPQTHYTALLHWQESDEYADFSGSVYGIWDDTSRTYTSGGVVEDSFKDQHSTRIVCAWGFRAELRKAMKDNLFDSTVPQCFSIKRTSGLDYQQMGTDWLELTRFLHTGHGDVVKLKMKAK